MWSRIEFVNRPRARSTTHATYETFERSLDGPRSRSNGVTKGLQARSILGSLWEPLRTTFGSLNGDPLPLSAYQSRYASSDLRDTRPLLPRTSRNINAVCGDVLFPLVARFPIRLALATTCRSPSSTRLSAQRQLSLFGYRISSQIVAIGPSISIYLHKRSHAR